MAVPAQTYYHGLIRRYVVAFGNMFSDIQVVRRKDGNVVQRLAVPIQYGPRRKWLTRLDVDPDLDRPVAITLPRMGFEIVGFAYDPTRKLQRGTSQSHGTHTQTNLTRVFDPVPYNMTFLLTIMTRNDDDGCQIIEQILPYFSPEYTLTMRMLDDPDTLRSVPIVIGGISYENSYDGDVGAREVISWNVDFTVKGYFYGPVSRSGIIRRTIVDLHTGLTEDTSAERIVAEIDPFDAEPEDDYEFSEMVEELNEPDTESGSI